MKVKVLHNNIQSIRAHLGDKRRIMTYGAGAWALDVKKILHEYGYQLDYALVDEEYVVENKFMHWQEGNGEPTEITSLRRLKPEYDSMKDAIIWTIASPAKFRSSISENEIISECYLLWDICNFWKDKTYAVTYREEFLKAREMLCDELSKNVFDGYIKAQQGDITQDVLYCTDGTYFNELTTEKKEGCFVDCGSYDGNDIIEYMKFIGRECSAYAFEPDKNNYNNLKKRMKDYSDIICINKGCWSEEATLHFNSQGDMSSGLDINGNEVVEVTTIDNAVGSTRVAFIKMDVEGAELEALKGAQNVIRRDMPILAISAYHKQEDFITLIPYIADLCNEEEKYCLYLRHHGIVQTELVIYAVPEKKI